MNSPSRGPLRVARLITRLNVGGPARHVVWLAEAMNNDEFETTLIAGRVPPGEDDMSAFATAHRVKPIVFPEMSRELSPSDLIAIWKMFRLFRRLQPDLVHTHTAKAGAVGRVAGILYRATTRRRCRFIHTYHGHVFHSYYGALKTRLFLSVERALARFATDRIVVLSPQQLHEIHTVFRIGRREQFTIVPLGIDLQSVSTSAAQRTQTRADLGISEKEALVGIVGRLAPIKNHDLFLRVARRLGNGVRFVIFGDGSEKPSIERSIDELQVRDRVSFAGVRDPAEIYSAADVIALTSLNEGTPLALIEAMAAGVPIVSTSVGGVVDLLGAVTASIDEQNARYEIRQRGITAASTDDAGFAAGLQRLLSDDRLRSTVARDAKEYVAKNYSKDRLVADIIRLTRELAAEPAQ